jgi:hypothetical protein
VNLIRQIYPHFNITLYGSFQIGMSRGFGGVAPKKGFHPFTPAISPFAIARCYSATHKKKGKVYCLSFSAFNHVLT